MELSLDRRFDYVVPPELEAGLSVGTPVVVPFGHGEQRGFVVGLSDRSEVPPGKLKAIRSVVGKQAMIQDRILDLARWMADYYLAPIEHAVHTVLPAAVRRRGAAHVERLMVSATEKARRPGAVEELRRRAPKQAAVLDRLLDSTEMLLSRLLAEAKTVDGTVRALGKKGLAHIRGGIAERNPLADRHWVPTEPLPLMTQQAEALDVAVRAIDTLAPPVVLLHGVTGSGKTEVYLQAIRHALDRGRGAIVLVPEIALTPQTVDRFRTRFGDGIAALHSSLSDGERHDEWHRIHEGRARIVIGARSALFAPVKDLGLVVVDEEHEPTYKQEESPRYNARDVAVMRGRLERCAVVLGSATPSLESWRNAQTGKYCLVRMPHRVDHRRMPTIRIVDMRGQGSGRDGRPGVFSRELVDAVEGRLARAEQTILFLNRRGYATALICPKCGHVERCEACSVAMTFHKKEGREICHLCGATREVPGVCPNPDCRDPSFRQAGLGTERVEEVLRKLFPRARLARMDSDTMTRKESYRQVLGDFRTGRLDILVGTQMIAKGLDFPNVTLVGVVNADTALHMPDFRAGERTFHLLTQVAGRAGRGEIAGEVIVQTFTPFHPAIQAARRMDFEGFCDQELEFRRQARYPPFFHLAVVQVRGPLERDVRVTAEALAAELKARLAPPAVLSAAVPAPIARVRGRWRYQVLLRAPRTRDLAPALRETLRGVKRPKDVVCAVDVDALSLL